MLDDYFIFLIAIVTTVAAYLVGKKLFGPPKVSLEGAARILMEYAGAFVVFLALNMVLGLGLILLIRYTTSRFVSVYLLDDFMVVVVSAVQGVLFRLWWSV